MKPLTEDFTRWLDDPMTRMVLQALELAETAQKQAWDAASWDGGMARADDLRDTLQELRVRADAYRSLREMTFEDVAAWLELKNDAE